MKNIYCALVLIFLSISSCKEFHEELFVPDKTLTGKILQNNDYERVWGIDVLMYEKQIDDLIIEHSFFDEEGNEIGYHCWNFTNISFNNIDEYSKKLKDLGFMPMTEVQLEKRIAVINHKTKGIYFSSWDESSLILSIIYHHLKY